MSGAREEPPPAFRCGHCGDVLGVYEPIVIVAEGSVTHTSRVALGDSLPAGSGWFHRDCWVSLGRTGT